MVPSHSQLGGSIYGIILFIGSETLFGYTSSSYCVWSDNGHYITSKAQTEYKLLLIVILVYKQVLKIFISKIITFAQYTLLKTTNCLSNKKMVKQNYYSA